MKVIRGEGGKLYPYKNEIKNKIKNETDTNNYSANNEARVIEAIILMEIVKALEHISQQIFEIEGR